MPPTLDRIDFEILTALQNDARVSNKELAQRVHLAPSSCLERVRRLRETKALRGFHAEVAPEALGIQIQAMVAVRLGTHASSAVSGFFREVGAHPSVVAIYYMAGVNDFLIHLAVRDTDQLRAFAVEVLGTRDEVAHIETSLIFDHHRSPVLPRYADE